ncbi:Predicted ATPase [gamma proteobacterium HdN1]|nr:Predicted ATPase [gamma proteobacterium HdN1]
MAMLDRQIQTLILEALEDSPVVLINGARQTGKSTLAQRLSPERRYLTLDDPAVFAAAKSDPFGFIANQTGKICLDEIQRAPELFLAIKAEVDKNRVAGRFLLTGSTNVLLLPQMADSLAGRMEIIELWPLSQSELQGRTIDLITLFYDGNFQNSYRFERNEFITSLVNGGFPEVRTRASDRRREAWFDSYLLTILQRDVRDLANIDGLTELPKLMQLLAARNGSLLNMAELSRSSGIAQTTLKRYLTLLETLFLVRRVPAWASNLGTRLQKSPKLFLSDYGMAAHLQGLGAAAMQNKHGLPGDLVEGFVHAELAKHQTWSSLRTHLMHYRTTTGVEVDFVLENRQQALVGVEVKAAATVVGKDFNGLRHLRDTAPKQFKRGILLYTGEQTIQFDEQLVAVPMGVFF